MAVFRVERNKGYTVMSNHHLRNKELSLKAKGLLSQMLSLPEDWDYTLAGLSFINREKIDAIREAVKELERAGYIVRSRERDEKGRLRLSLIHISEEGRCKSCLRISVNPYGSSFLFDPSCISDNNLICYFNGLILIMSNENTGNSQLSDHLF